MLSFCLVLAEKLGRTVHELLFGSAVHEPITLTELRLWMARESILFDEIELAKSKAASRG